MENCKKKKKYAITVIDFYIIGNLIVDLPSPSYRGEILKDDFLTNSSQFSMRCAFRKHIINLHIL